MPHVLAIEDSPLDAALLRDTFAAHAPPGSDLVIVETVRDGLARIAERMPDLVLLDVNLPDGDGWELMRGAMRGLDDSAVVLWTAEADDATRERAARDADGYIHKSVAMGTLWPSAFAVLDGVRSRARATNDILVVNDDAAENALIEDIIEPLLDGGRVVVARSVDEAIARVREQVATRAVPRLALVDWQLPGATGDALLEHLAAQPAATAMRTVVLTGCVTPGAQARCLALGAREVAIKPFTVDGWVELFERLVPVRRTA